jgi:hypothetical protein
MGRPRIYEQGRYRYYHKSYDVRELIDSDVVFTGNGRSKREIESFAVDLLVAGLVIYDIILTEVGEITYLKDGEKRVKACAWLCGLSKDEFAEIGEAYDVKQADFRKIPAKIFKDIDPDNQIAWTIILNEQRSDNPIAAYMEMKRLKDSGDWDAVSKLYKLNKSRFNKLATLDDLENPEEAFQAFAEGRMAETTLFDLAKLGARQKMAMKVLEKTKKLTGNNIKDVRKVQAEAILATMPKMDMKLPDVQEVEPVKELFAVLILTDPGDIPPHKLKGPYEGFVKGQEMALAMEGKLYRLLEI